MQIPGNMVAPRMKLDEGEEVVGSYEGMRKKGIFGNRFGALVVTNKRAGFVKAIMKSGLISAAANKIGVKPMLSWNLDQIEKAERAKFGKLDGVEITADGKTEKLAIDPAQIDALIAALAK